MSEKDSTHEAITVPDQQSTDENTEVKASEIPLRKRLLDLMLVNLKIGSTSFGAPTAHVSMMEREYVHKHKWVTPQHFLDLLSAANIIPGPNASETCYHVGYAYAGYPGLFVAGISFILPAIISALILSWVYMRYGALPEMTGLFYFLNPLVLAIVLDSTFRLAKSSYNNWKQIPLFIAIIVAKILGANEVIILLGAGLVMIVVYFIQNGFPKKAPPAMMLLLLPIAEAIEKHLPTVKNIFLYFLRTGTVLFGSSMVLFGLIQNDIVNRFGWLNMQQLTDAIAMGQITPGPVLASSTFVGFLAAGLNGTFFDGLKGGLAATIGVFLPSFVIVAVTAPIVKKMRESEVASAFLSGVNVATVALILMVSITLAQNGVVDIWTALLALGGLAALIFLKLPPWVLVLSGLAMGALKIFVF
jgi:chromate transporter